MEVKIMNVKVKCDTLVYKDRYYAKGETIVDFPFDGDVHKDMFDIPKVEAPVKVEQPKAEEIKTEAPAVEEVKVKAPVKRGRK